MSLNFKEKVRKEILDEISSQDFQYLFKHIQKEIPALDSFCSPDETIKFMHEANDEYKRKDAVLYGLLCKLHYCTDSSNRILWFLIAILWPAMDHLSYELFRYLPEPENLFAEIYWEYIELLHTWNLEKTNIIAKNLKMNAKKRLVRAFQCRSEIITPKPAKTLTVSPESRNDMLDVLEELQQNGIITLEESLLIRGHVIYGAKLVDMAGGNGVNISGAGHCRLDDVYVEGAGASGAGSGLLIDGMSLNAKKNFICNCAFMASFDQGALIKGPNATGNYFYQTAFLGNGKYGVKEENAPDLNIVRDCSFAGNGSGDYLIVGAASKVENPGDIATAAAEKVWNKDVDDNTFSAGKMGYWFYKLKQYFLNRKDAGITTPGEETFYKDDNVTIAMSGAMKKSSGSSWNPPTEGVAQRERMS